jgi:hypothetical protein
VRKGSTASWVGDHCQTTLWQIDKNLKSETGHGTQKPVECMRQFRTAPQMPGQAAGSCVRRIGLVALCTGERFRRNENVEGSQKSGAHRQGH